MPLWTVLVNPRLFGAMGSAIEHIHCVYYLGFRSERQFYFWTVFQEEVTAPLMVVEPDFKGTAKPCVVKHACGVAHWVAKPK